jgi:hypothetical protein
MQIEELQAQAAWAGLTDAERAAMQLADANKVVRDEFAKLGIEVPKTRDEFRALAESQDLTTARGRLVYAVLMDIADEFLDVTSSAASAVSTSSRVQR